MRDALVAEKIKEVHEQNYSVYGVRKVYAELARQAASPTSRSPPARWPA